MERSRGGFHSANLFFFHTTPSPGGGRLRGAARTAGFRIAPYTSQESVASLQGPGVEKRVGAVPRFGQRPPPCAFPDSERGQRASRSGGPRRRGGLRVARSITAGNSGLALSVRAPGLPAAPRPRLPLTLSDGDAAGELLRSLRGNPEPARAAGASFPPPRRPPGRARLSCACCAARWAPSSALPPAPGGRLRTRYKS